MSCLPGSLLLSPSGAPSVATVRESGWGSTAHTHPGEVSHTAEAEAATSAAAAAEAEGAAEGCLLSTSNTTLLGDWTCCCAGTCLQQCA